MKIDYNNVLNAFKEIDLDSLEAKTNAARNKLLAYGEMKAWIDYPENIKEAELNLIKGMAKKMRGQAKILVVVGIGGSYLGTKAILGALKPYFKEPDEVKIMFAGNTLSSTYMVEMLEYLESKDFCICYISRSGNTAEPAVAFRLLKNLAYKKYADANERIYIITNEKEGNAYKMAQNCGFNIMTIPDNIGGRFSAFTATTMFPAACIGIDIDDFIKGGRDSAFDCKQRSFSTNVALKYAAFRNVNYDNGKKIEVLCTFSPRFAAISEWWEQLFAESEGKDGKGLFPTSLVFSTALHSIGQYLQDGPHILFETFLNVERSHKDLRFPHDEDNYDDLNYLDKFTLYEMNNKMLEATILAHAKGNTPNIVLEIEKLDTYNLGYLMYMLMFSCGVSAYMLDVNPFNQPGVEEYKNNMYALLEKKGYEELRKELEKKL